MTELDFYLPVPLAVLIAYLLWSFNRRLNAEIARAEARNKDWQHNGFEPATISPRIEMLRRDYVSAVRSRRPTDCSHIERVVNARCAVRELSFFRRLCRVATEQPTEKPT
jgi:SET domain-containing protein